MGGRSDRSTGDVLFVLFGEVGDGNGGTVMDWLINTSTGSVDVVGVITCLGTISISIGDSVRLFSSLQGSFSALLFL